jgi:hypothetical protein
VLLANRSAQLMKLAAILLFRLCRNVLLTDLSWPSYRLILERIGRSTNSRLKPLALRKRILSDQIQPDELVHRIVRSFLRSGCDGLFLPAVDNLGIRLPIRQIVHTIEQHAELRFVAVDGAQAFCHVPLQLAEVCCDFLIAGCHKWLQGYHPMGVAFYGHPRSRQYVERTIRQLQSQRVLDDPLLRFVSQLERGVSSRYGETVNLNPLFSCQGALQDQSRHSTAETLCQRRTNADELVSALAGTSWKPLRPADGLRSGILLVQGSTEAHRQTSPGILRRKLHEAGIVASTYAKGMVRISLPGEPWCQLDLDHLNRAFGAVVNNWSTRQIKATPHCVVENTQPGKTCRRATLKVCPQTLPSTRSQRLASAARRITFRGRVRFVRAARRRSHPTSIGRAAGRRPCRLESPERRFCEAATTAVMSQ